MYKSMTADYPAVINLAVSGTIPSWFSGRLFRTGPGAWEEQVQVTRRAACPSHGVPNLKFPELSLALASDSRSLGWNAESARSGLSSAASGPARQAGRRASSHGPTRMGRCPC